SASLADGTTASNLEPDICCPGLPVRSEDLTSAQARKREPIMNSKVLSRQGQYLLQLGIILILYSSIEGFAIPLLGSQRLGLSVHTLSALQGVFLLAQGLLWPKLKLGVTASWVAFWCSIHGTLAILAAYTIASIWGV